MANVIECTGVSKAYGGFFALDEVTVAVPDGGGIVGLLGPNGSGKTTLIKILAGLLQPTSGEVRICGHKVGTETKALVSYLSDCYALNQGFTVEEELTYFSDFFFDFNREKAERMLRELAVKRDAKIKTLSKGTKEKLALILTLSRNAKLYVLDEPIAGVDPAARQYVLDTILANRSENSTILLSTHLISEIEEYFDYVLFLKEGHIVLEGKTEEVKANAGKSVNELFKEVFKWMV